jgi:hypothetical protein
MIEKIPDDITKIPRPGESRKDLEKGEKDSVSTKNKTPEDTYSPELKKRLGGFGMDEKDQKDVKKDVMVKENSEKKKEIEKKEKKEYTNNELLNAAEVFCKYNPFGYKTEQEKTAAQNAVIELVKKEHSPEEIAAAVRVAEVRNNMRTLTDRTKLIEEQYKNAKENPSADIAQATAKHDQQIENIRRDKKLYENEFGDLLRNLKIENIKNQLKNIEKFRDHDDFSEKVENVEKTALAMINTESMRWQDARIDVNRKINPEGWDHVVNFFSRVGEKMSKSKILGGYFRMNRHVRAACTAAVIGAGTAIALPSAVIAAGVGTAGYLGIKTINALTGGAFSYQLSKRIFQPLGEKTYRGDTKKTTQELQKEALGDENVRKLEQVARGETTDDVAAEILSKIAKKNIEIGEKYAKEMRRHRNYYKINRILGTFAAGLLGGKAAVMTTDYLLGQNVLNIFDTKGTQTPETATPGGKGGEVVPIIEQQPNIPKGFSPETDQDILKAATIGRGEGIEHALRRQLELNPDKFGFKGNLSDRAAIHEWSGGQAHRIAINEGYIDQKAGVETWVRDIGPQGPEGNPAYVLNIDASGKPTIHEFIEGKPAGAGSESAYEYWHETPKPVAHEISEGKVLEVPPTPKASDGGVIDIVTKDVTVESSDSPINNDLKVEMVEPVITRSQFFDTLETQDIPTLEKTADNFSSLSLADQDAIMHSPRMEYLAEHMRRFGRGGSATPDEVDLLGKVNEHYANMSTIYEETVKRFNDAVKTGTGFRVEKQINKFLGTKINDVWDAYEGKDKVLDFVKSVNPTSGEWRDGVLISEVLKSRFLEDHFGFK